MTTLEHIEAAAIARERRRKREEKQFQQAEVARLARFYAKFSIRATEPKPDPDAIICEVQP